VYVVVSFVIGVIGFSLSVTALTLVVSVFVVPIGAVVTWSGGTVIQGIEGPLSELPIPLTVTLVTIALIAFAVFAGTLVWLLGLLQAHVVNGFLSNGYLPALKRLTQKATNKLRVNEGEVQDALNQPQTRESLAELSPREKEVLALMAQGKSNAGIASTLFITEGSVEKHVSNILSKMDLPQNGDQHRRVLAVLEYLGIEPGVEEVTGQTSGVTRSD
jgi:DNA-binding CsgD family transcriptional regulator